MAECRNKSKQLFNFSAFCPDEPCSFNGTYQPALFGQFVVSEHMSIDRHFW